MSMAWKQCFVPHLAIYLLHAPALQAAEAIRKNTGVNTGMRGRYFTVPSDYGMDAAPCPPLEMVVFLPDLLVPKVLLSGILPDWRSPPHLALHCRLIWPHVLSHCMPAAQPILVQGIQQQHLLIQLHDEKDKWDKRTKTSGEEMTTMHQFCKFKVSDV